MRRHAILLLLAVVALAVTLWAALPPRAQAQLSPWPTPPPGPVGVIPEVVPANEVTPVPVPSAPGSIALQVDPIFAGPVPRFPPRPSIPVETGESDPQDRVTLEFDAGALLRTAQLTYQPLPVGLAPAPPTGRRLLRAFQLSLYDPKGAPITPTFKFPVRMSLHPRPQDVAAAGNNPARLLLARYDDQAQHWQPLVTTSSHAGDTIMARILQPGLYALIAIPAPLQ